MITPLFIRSYPAPGAQIIPVSYRSGAWGYYVSCLIPTVATFLFAALLFNSRHTDDWLIWALVISILVLCLVVAFLRALKLELKMEGITYSSPFRGTKFLQYSEISSVVLLDYLHNGGGGSSRTLRRWTVVITPKVETGKVPIKIPLTLFPRDAYNELVRLLKPEIWESDTT